MVFDGSYQPNMDESKGIKAWEIHCKDMDKHQWWSFNTTPQVKNLYRSQLIGLYAILALLVSLCQLYKLHKGEVDIGCYNEQDIYKASELSPRIYTNTKNVDVLREIKVVCN